MAFPTCQNESQFTTGGGVGRGSLQTHWEKVLRLSHEIWWSRMRVREARFSSEMVLFVFFLGGGVGECF